MPASAEALFAWHERPGAFMRLAPPWTPVRLERFEGIRDGNRAVIRLGPGPGLRWVAEHHDYVAGQQFCDRQVTGPFRAWHHTHRMEPLEDGTSRLIDDIYYEPPLGALGELLGHAAIRHQLARQFAYRHRITRQDLTWHDRYNPDGRRLRIAITGASGLLGSSLTSFLTTGGHEVLRLVRSRPTGPDEAYWNVREGEIDADALEGMDAVIHLAGENVFAPRWTAAKKQRIYESRVEGTRLLTTTLAALDDPPEVVLAASAIGIYGDRGAAWLTEASAPAEHGFLATVVRDWEAAAQPARLAGIRTVHLRIGVVLTPAGGALQLMLPPFFLGLGGPVGSGDQYVPWVALDDVIGAFYHALMTDALDGPVNVTAPHPVTMGDLTGTLGDVLSRPTLLQVPAPVLRALSGEAADEMLLSSARVAPDRLRDDGYAFAYPRLGGALRHLLGRTLDPLDVADPLPA
jgi:uncharacterized protein (TIGR01777 family)